MRGRFLMLCLGLSVAVAGAAQASDPGLVRAQSFAPAPAGGTVGVQPTYGRLSRLQSAAAIVERPARCGEQPVSSDGRLLLTFATAVVQADEGGAGPTLGQTSASDYTDRNVTASQGDGTQIMDPEPRVPQGIGRQILDSDIRV